MIIGFSTGCLYGRDMTYLEKIKFIKKTGANAIELGLGTLRVLYNFKATKSIIKELKEFEYISIHAPFIETRYEDNSESRKTMKKLEEIYKKLKADIVVVHADEIGNLKFLSNQKIPIALENMDKRKEFGKTPEEIAKAKKYGKFKFILDLQHAYENDHSMKIVDKLSKVMGKNIKHLHVSGQTKKRNHVSVCNADNNKEILKALKKMPKIPIISEGFLLGNIEKNAKKELEILRKAF